jgi:hypothetical protein
MFSALNRSCHSKYRSLPSFTPPPERSSTQVVLLPGSTTLAFSFFWPHVSLKSAILYLDFIRIYVFIPSELYPLEESRLVTMIGVIPRQVERRQNLSLIN